MKKIIFILLSSSYLLGSIDYSIGLNDKIGFIGIFDKTWVKEQEYGESYKFVATSFLVAGGIGYGQKYHFLKSKNFTPYLSISGFGYYVLGIGAVGGLGVSSTLGVDIDIIKWKENNKLIFQFGLFSGYDIVNGQSLVLEGDGGPSFLMPSINLKLSLK